MKTFPFSLMVVVLMFTACGSTKEHTPTPANTDTPNPPTPTPITQPLNGTYTTSITKAELISAGMTDAIACENAGVLALTAVGDRWSIIQTSAPGCTVQNPKWGGSWKFSGDQVSFHDDSSIGCSVDYTYKWSFNGSSLHFISVDDSSCPQRVYYMSEHPWIK